MGFLKLIEHQLRSRHALVHGRKLLFNDFLGQMFRTFLLQSVSIEMGIYKDGVSKYSNNQLYPNEIKMLSQIPDSCLMIIS